MPDIADILRRLPFLTDGVALQLGPVVVRWYGLLWVAAFAVVACLLVWRLQRGELPRGMDRDMIADLTVWSLVAALVGGRLGYVLLYAPAYFLAHPAAIVWPLHDGTFVGIAGMSFHGAAVGVGVAWLMVARRAGLSLLTVADVVVPAVPWGYVLGRVANFLNGELYGRPTDVPWGMLFPAAPDGGTIARHPSQLYEALGEGALLGVLLWHLRGHRVGSGRLSAVLLGGYAIVRFGIEYVRAPDAHIGLLAGGLTMGQVLCIAMAAVAVVVYWQGSRRNVDSL